MLITPKVCSRAVARASPVLKAKLDGPSGEQPGDPWVVDLVGDLPEEVERFLAMVHADFARVPPSLTIPQLYRFLAFLLKYDAMPAIRPWARQWLDGVSKQTHQPWLLWVAWTMGGSEVFRNMLLKIAEDTTFNFTEDDVDVYYGEPGSHWTPDGEQGSSQKRRVPVNSLGGLSAADVIRTSTGIPPPQLFRSLTSSILTRFRARKNLSETAARAWSASSSSCIGEWFKACRATSAMRPANASPP